jgi:hypothetical protein
MLIRNTHEVCTLLNRVGRADFNAAAAFDAFGGINDRFPVDQPHGVDDTHGGAFGAPDATLLVNRQIRAAWFQVAPGKEQSTDDSQGGKTRYSAASSLFGFSISHCPTAP